MAKIILIVLTSGVRRKMESPVVEGIVLNRLRTGRVRLSVLEITRDGNERGRARAEWLRREAHR